ncbi:hypothetical protein NDU88_006876 [Pleurodeles waltl]|uniref:Uncharacterized protein n=1 Tax=Pleurodeles waltl TaxID=8319 RepID=A0AAV7MEB1_PLEWA|nr:hypothetical protein NDU88_006876 [Pleurodeles waltl]
MSAPRRPEPLKKEERSAPERRGRADPSEESRRASLLRGRSPSRTMYEGVRWNGGAASGCRSRHRREEDIE